jgi:hypothetical protein
MAQVTEDQFEKRKWVYEVRRDAANRAHDKAHDYETKTSEATVNVGQAAIRTAVLINGGAAIAILGLIGALIGKDERATSMSDLSEVALSLQWFAFGVASGTAALGFSYVTNYSSVRRSATRTRTFRPPYFIGTRKTTFWRWVGRVFQWGAVLLAAVSIGLFIHGMIAVREAIEQL